MLWFALTGIPLFLLWMAINVSKDLWLKPKFIPRSRYYRVYRRVIFSIEVFLSLFIALIAYPFLVMHSDQISAFFMGTVVAWLEPWYDLFMDATMAGFALVFGFLWESLTK
jgi:hypothetical protein